jgi:ABC-type cobalt transport system substrate-binding protein
MKKTLIRITLTGICCLVLLVVSWAGIYTGQQAAAQKGEEKESHITNGKVSYGTLPVFTLLLTPTINALKKATNVFGGSKEEACAKRSKSLKPISNIKSGSC